MNRRGKIALLKKVAKGDSKALTALKDAQDKNGISVTNIFLCFYYLLEHGRPGEYKGALKFDPCFVQSINDLMEKKAGLDSFAKNGNFESTRDEELQKLLECMQCYEILKETKKLDKLNKYKHLLD